MSARALITDYAWPTLDVEREVLSKADVELVIAETGDEQELVELAGDVDAILTCWQTVSAPVLEAARSCRTVARYGVGTDNIDVARASELGMVVTRVPDYCIHEVADHAMALLLAAARGVCRFDRQTRTGTWDNKAAGAIPRLSEQTLGLIGYGNVARAMVPRAKGFGLSVMAYNRSGDETEEDGVRITPSFEGVLRAADYLSVHVPLVDATRHLIDEAALRAMKPTAYLINTARGPIVDEAAVAKALNEGWLAGAAMDVMEVEPPAADNPLVGRDDMILTPHAAFYSESSIEELERKAAQNVVDVLTGVMPADLYVVNPEVLAQENSRVAAQR